MSNAFKRAEDRYGQSAPAETPYGRAGRVRDDLLGEARGHTRAWRTMAFGSLVLAAISTCTLIYVQLNHPISTYIVPIDRYGRPGRVELADKAYRPDQAAMGAYASLFIERVRSKSTDPVVLGDNWQKAKRMTNAAARATLMQYAETHDPAARLGQEAISLEIVTVLPRSPTTFQVQWRETTYLNGVAGPPERWTGLVSVGRRPVRDEAQVLANPLGLEITSFQWSREL